MLTYSGTISRLRQQHLDFAFLSSARHFHLSSYFLQTGLQPFIPELLKRLKAAGLTISLDTNDDPEDRWDSGIERVLPLVDVFLPNEREAQKVTQSSNLDDALSKLIKIVPLVVVKLGASGAMACRGSERLSAPAISTLCVDSVGAGDSFDAGFLHSYVRGENLQACLESGNRAGALSVTRPGGTEAFRDQVHREDFCGAIQCKSPNRRNEAIFHICRFRSSHGRLRSGAITACRGFSRLAPRQNGRPVHHSLPEIPDGNGLGSGRSPSQAVGIRQL